ncbi:hypothetical protein Vretimale_4792 [Volvox reticuliferus]|uniref:Uncharacterized protein n=1 Tax=Volvox reticuliferus TaxID=1737510 RepID=A0A8J4DBZ9_9CHLO|nr:hypothetical protein Vretimale_4792 [Volvox reticuliferus]
MEHPLAVSGFCADGPPGHAHVISCLQINMDKGHFPAGCRLVIQQLTDLAAVKYSLNFRLRQECDDCGSRGLVIRDTADTTFECDSPSCWRTTRETTIPCRTTN